MKFIIIFSVLTTLIANNLSAMQLTSNDLIITKFSEFEHIDLNKNEVHLHYINITLNKDLKFNLSRLDIFSAIESELIKYGLFLVNDDLDENNLANSSTIINFVISDMGLLGVQVNIIPEAAHFSFNYYRRFNNKNGKTFYASTYNNGYILQNFNTKEQLLGGISALTEAFAVDYIKSNKSVAKKALD